MTALSRLARLRTEWWLVLAASAMLLAALVRTDATARLDYLIYDLLLRSGGSQSGRAQGDDILIVAIDNRSLTEIGAWPWPRTTQARLIEKLGAASPKAIGLDVLLTDAREPASDARLAAAIAGAGHVYLPLAFDVPGRDGRGFTAEPPLLIFAGGAAGIGHVNLSPDADGVIRRVYLGYSGAGQAWPALPALMAGRRAAALAGSQPGLVGRDPVMIDYRGPRGSFPTIPAASVLRGEVPTSLIAGRMVLLGVTASGLGDSHATPVGGDGVLMPGVEVQANLLATLRSGRAIVPAPEPFAYAFALIPLALLFVAMRALPPRMTGLAALCLALAVAVLSWGLFRFAAVWLGPACALLGITLAYPLWAWRKLAVASGYISRELERAASEAGEIGHVAPAVGGGFLDRQLALLEDTTTRDRELRRQREDVLRLLSHDMRAPQSSILALLDGAESDRIDAELGARIRGYARRTLELADDFVNLSRAQLLEFIPVLLDLAELARDAADALWPQARARGLKLVVTAPEDTEVLVAGEASLLARMLINLADNAIKYADPAGTIELSVTSEGDKAAVCVTNCGPDIPEAAITELFERFTRAGGHAGSTEGAGLGLAFVATVAARHGGSASCSSGGGMTAFTVTLPLARDPAAQ